MTKRPVLSGPFFFFLILCPIVRKTSSRVNTKSYFVCFSCCFCLSSCEKKTKTIILDHSRVTTENRVTVNAMKTVWYLRNKFFFYLFVTRVFFSHCLHLSCTNMYYIYYYYYILWHILYDVWNIEKKLGFATTTSNRTKKPVKLRNNNNRFYVSRSHNTILISISLLFCYFNSTHLTLRRLVILCCNQRRLTICGRLRE